MENPEAVTEITRRHPLDPLSASEVAAAVRILRIHGPAVPTQAFPRSSGTRYLEERRRARRIPELDPLRAALQGISHAEHIERHSEPGLLASVYHLIDRGASAGYRRIVEATALPGLRASISGPWPAWSFAPEPFP